MISTLRRFIGLSSSSKYEIRNRLQDILAAIQVMGASVWDARPIEHWLRYLGGKPQSAPSWKELFDEHPEFFHCLEHRDEKEYYQLRFRSAYERSQTIKRDDGTSCDVRPELEPEQIGMLMKTAIDIHQREAARIDRNMRWLQIFVPILLALIPLSLKITACPP